MTLLQMLGKAWMMGVVLLTGRDSTAEARVRINADVRIGGIPSMNGRQAVLPVDFRMHYDSDGKKMTPTYGQLGISLQPLETAPESGSCEPAAAKLDNVKPSTTYPKTFTAFTRQSTVNDNEQESPDVQTTLRSGIS